MSYKRLTIRDEFGNADIFGVDSELLYNELSFTEANALTKAFNRLAKLEDKIENGTLIELPCKVGTTLYFIATEEQEDINGFKYGILESNKWLYVIDKNGEITIEENDCFFKFEYTYDYTFGENVFLTKAEAEKKLEELSKNP